MDIFTSRLGDQPNVFLSRFLLHMGKQTLLVRSRRKRGFKRKPRLRLLPGSARAGGKDGIHFDGHEALPGEVGFNYRRYLKDEQHYVQSGIEDGYDGDRDVIQKEWEEDADYHEAVSYTHLTLPTPPNV